MHCLDILLILYRATVYGWIFMLDLMVMLFLDSNWHYAAIYFLKLPLSRFHIGAELVIHPGVCRWWFNLPSLQKIKAPTATSTSTTRLSTLRNYPHVSTHHPKTPVSQQQPSSLLHTPRPSSLLLSRFGEGTEHTFAQSARFTVAVIASVRCLCSKTCISFLVDLQYFLAWETV